MIIGLPLTRYGQRRASERERCCDQRNGDAIMNNSRALYNRVSRGIIVAVDNAARDSRVLT
jgi:hypothetical protein